MENMPYVALETTQKMGLRKDQRIRKCKREKEILKNWKEALGELLKVACQHRFQLLSGKRRY